MPKTQKQESLEASVRFGTFDSNLLVNLEGLTTRSGSLAVDTGVHTGQGL
jgi:hypothetical protein